MKKQAEIYVHIPFCVKKCDYCDFLSFAGSEEIRNRYVRALIREIESYRNSYENKEILEVPTIFLGGGTPSVLSKAQLDGILEHIFSVFRVQKDAEISMEMNPGTQGGGDFVLPQKVNRVSIGLQSVNNDELKMLGRIHTWEDFLETYEKVRRAGVKNVNVDLISAIPGQTAESWEKTLRTVAKLEPEHISAYSLIVEEGTPFYDRELDLPSEEDERLIYEMTGGILREYGYLQYEISNYARPGYLCRHNAGYWRRTPYLGLGLGASSLWEDQRFSNTRDMERYLLDSNEPDKIRENKESLTRKDTIEEFMFLGLRMTEGISKKIFYDTFGAGVEEIYKTQVQRMKDMGLLCEEGDRIFLTRPGISLSNQVFLEFMLDDSPAK